MKLSDFSRLLSTPSRQQLFTSGPDLALIKRAGNAQARTILIEAGWSCRLPAREERRYRERVIDLPEETQAIGRKAQFGCAGVTVDWPPRQAAAQGDDCDCA